MRWKHASNSISARTRATIEVSAEMLAQVSTFFDELFVVAFDELQLLERGGFLPKERENWSTRAVYIEGRYQANETWYHGDMPFRPQLHYRVGGNTKMFGAALFRGNGPCPAPPFDNLLVLYIPDRQARDAVVLHLQAMGHMPVPPRNPYWAEQSVTIPDPDGWQIVLMNTPGFEDDIGCVVKRNT